MYREEDFLMISGIQHFLFCRRQWALIHIEQQWQENVRTIEGSIFHQTAHDSAKHEKRRNLITTRGMRVHSYELGVSGICDVVEFHESEEGIQLNGYEGEWIPYPVEYKKGSPKEEQFDEAQLCLEGMCLEEMLKIGVNEGCLYYGEPRRRKIVRFSEELRSVVNTALKEMHQIYTRGNTPKAKRTKSCNACSLKEICLPQLEKRGSVRDYIEERLS